MPEVNIFYCRPCQPANCRYSLSKALKTQAECLLVIYKNSFLKDSGQNVSQQINARTYFSHQEWNEKFRGLLSLLKFHNGSTESYFVQAFSVACTTLGYNVLWLLVQELLATFSTSTIWPFVSEAHRNIMKAKKSSWLQDCVNITLNFNLEKTSLKQGNEKCWCSYGTWFTEQSNLSPMCVEHMGFYSEAEMLIKSL